jgi:CHAD domain-containing protein
VDLVAPHLDRALAAALGRRPLGREAVHEIRRELRRARAGLRLVRDAVGRRAYAEENRTLRDAARPLSAARDADVMLQTIDRLLERDLPPEESLWLRRLRAAARREQGQCRRALRGALVEGVVGGIRQARAQVGNWRLPHDPAQPVAAGLERIYRQGRRHLRDAEERPTDRALHELRKQVKFLAAALRLLPALGMAPDEAAATRADTVTRLLGEDHDLVLLRRRFGGASRGLVARVARRRRKLQKKALKEARRLYRRKRGFHAR